MFESFPNEEAGLINNSESNGEVCAVGSSILDVCAAVGFVAINWSLIERQLDNCCHIAFEVARTNGMRVTKPRALDDKFKFIRKHVVRSAHFASLTGTVTELLATTKRLAKKRHMLLHGAIESIDNGKLILNRFRYSENYVTYNEMFDLNDFQPLADELGEAVRDWLELSHQLIGIEVRRYL